MKLKAPRRSIYSYICAGCHRKRSSFVYVRAAEVKLCRNCRRCLPADNQPGLFGVFENAAVMEYGGKGCEGIADVLGITQSGMTHEFEVKVAKGLHGDELSAFVEERISPKEKIEIA